MVAANSNSDRKKDIFRLRIIALRNHPCRHCRGLVYSYKSSTGEVFCWSCGAFIKEIVVSPNSPCRVCQGTIYIRDEKQLSCRECGQSLKLVLTVPEVGCSNCSSVSYFYSHPKSKFLCDNCQQVTSRIIFASPCAACGNKLCVWIEKGESKGFRCRECYQKEVEEEAEEEEKKDGT